MKAKNVTYDELLELAKRSVHVAIFSEDAYIATHISNRLCSQLGFFNRLKEEELPLEDATRLSDSEYEEIKDQITTVYVSTVMTELNGHMIADYNSICDESAQADVHVTCHRNKYGGMRLTLIKY